MDSRSYWKLYYFCGLNLIIFKIPEMRKIFVTLLLGVICCLTNMQAQVTISVSSALVDRNANATVDVTVNGFTNIAGMQFSLNYDTTVLEFVSFNNVTSLLPDLASGLVSHKGTSFKNGNLVAQWNDANGVTLPANTRLFSIVFKAIGAEGSKSDIVLSGKPRTIEIFDVNKKVLTVTGNKGTVTIKGKPSGNTCEDPPCTNPTNTKIFGDVVKIKKGDTICVPIRVKNFKNLISIQGSLNWDPTILSYRRVIFPSTGGIPGFGGRNDYNDGKSNQGKFSYLWSADNGVSLPDSAIIMQLCFDAIGNVGDVGCIKMSDQDVQTLWEKDGAGIIPLCFGYGKVTITDKDPDPDPSVVTLNLGTGSGKKGDIVCIDVSVKNFKDIFTIQTTFSWNPAQLRFVRTEGYNLDGLNSGVFNNSASTLKMSWNNGTAQTKSDGHIIFKMCFELLCPDNNNYSAQVTAPGPTEIAGSSNGSPVKVPSQINGNSISITCADTPNPSCATGAITQPSCNGGSDGSAAMTVTNGNSCDYQWKTTAGTVIKSGEISKGNLTLTGVKAGTYTFSIVCSGVVATTCTAVITEPSKISIPTNNVVTNENCGNKGQINISGTSGGTGSFTFNWDPSQGNTANPSNLSAGTYKVTVTDAKGCTATESFVITDAITPLAVSATPIHIKCNGDSNGSASVVVSGGCAPYTYSWSGGLTGDNPQGLRAGTYNVTVSDSSNPAHTSVQSVTINQPSAISSSVSNIKKASTDSASDGQITIQISGGTPGYNAVWSGNLQGGATNGTQTVTNVKAGTYSVTITDANGCSSVINNIIVQFEGTTVVQPEIGTVSATSNFNGFGVSCFGSNNGVISGTVSKGTLPVTVTLKSGNQTIGSPQVINTTSFSFSNLVAGNYTVTVENSAGTVTSTSIRITQPTKLAATVKSNCSDVDKENGSIEVNMNNTGAGNYSYVWLQVNDLDNKIENVGVGSYNLTVTDANGCELSIQNLEVKACEINLGDCYNASTIITPNGDNLNDLFLINCVIDNPSDLQVFDRWGRLVYSQLNYDNTWQGIDNTGKDLKEGGYIWVLTVNYGQGRKEIYKGTVTLLRGNK